MLSRAEAYRSPEPSLRVLLRTEHIRRAITLVIVFTTTLVVTLAIAFWFLRADAMATMDRDNRQALATFVTAEETETFEEFFATEAAIANPQERIFAFIDADGNQSGNATVVLGEGEPDFEPLVEGRELSRHYRSLIAPIHGGSIVIARSTNPVMRLAETFVALIVFTVIPTTAIAIASAVAINARSSRRIFGIRQVLERLTHGDLSARVASSEPGEIGEIEAAIDRMAAAQEDAVGALRQVTADIAHELRTPLQRISVHLAELGEETDGSKRAELVEKISVETQRSVEIFQALLQIAQIEGGGSSLRKERFNASTLIADLTELYRPVAEDKGFELLGPGKGRDIWMWGDERLIGQAIANLIENALRHTTGGTINCAVSRSEGLVEITVSDTGVGIPAAEREKVFDRLYRLEHSRTSPGSGLGLSLVRAIVEAHEGSVRLEENDPGLRCILLFPDRDADQ